MESSYFDDWILADGDSVEALDAKIQELIRSYNELLPPNPEQIVQYQPPPEQREMENATKCGDLAAVKNIFEKWRAEPKNKQESSNFFGTSLHLAVKGRHLAIAAYLIEHVTSNFRDSVRNPGFGTAMVNFEWAMYMESYEFMELFLHHGFDLNISWSEYYTTPLGHSFENEEMTRWLLDHGADPNAESRINNTPLSRAIQSAPMSIIKMLFDRGGPDCINHGELLLCVTYRKLPDRVEVLEYLFTKGAQRNIDKLLHQDRPGLFREENLIIGCNVPLHVASRTGDLDVVKFLVAHGADARKPDGKGQLPIQHARESHHDDVVQYLTPISVYQPKL